MRVRPYVVSCALGVATVLGAGLVDYVIETWGPMPAGSLWWQQGTAWDLLVVLWFLIAVPIAGFVSAIAFGGRLVLKLAAGLAGILAVAAFMFIRAGNFIWAGDILFIMIYSVFYAAPYAIGFAGGALSRRPRAASGVSHCASCGGQLWGPWYSSEKGGYVCRRCGAVTRLEASTVPEDGGADPVEGDQRP